MTSVAAKSRAARCELFKPVLAYLQTKSAMRFQSRQSQLRAAAKAIARNIANGTYRGPLLVRRNGES